MKCVIIAALCITMATPAQADQQERREKECRYQWVDHRTWTAREEWRTAKCVVERWPVPGGLSEFSRIISCESGWSRFAYNPIGPYVGLGQHALRYWTGRLTYYSPIWWNLDPRWKNSRTMLTITARMMHEVGLSPWACA